MSSNNSCSFFVLFSLILLAAPPARSATHKQSENKQSRVVFSHAFVGQQPTMVNFDYADLTISSSCLRKCGGIDIPYPFGIGKGCYLEKWYEIECANSSILGTFEPFLTVIQKQVVSITLPNQLSDQFSSESSYGSILIKNQITSKGCSTDEEKPDSLLNLTGMPFYVGLKNLFIAVGCNNKASLTNVEPNMVECMTTCGPRTRTNLDDSFATTGCNRESLNRRMAQFCEPMVTWSRVNEPICNGNGCCTTSMPNGVQRVVDVKIEDNNITTEGCKVAFLTSLYPEELFNGYNPQKIHALRFLNVRLGWFIHTRNLSFIDSLGCQNLTEYTKNTNFDPTTSCVCDKVDLSYARCACNSGYKGNPYVGCKDLDECLNVDYDGNSKNYCERGRTCVNKQGHYECVYPKTRLIAIGIGAGFGMLILTGGIYWLYKFSIEEMRLNKNRKFFKRNGGLLLQQQLISTEGNVKKARVFSSMELEKATENFSLNRILGEGGQGTVYKGMLVDGRIVAVKKSKVVDKDKLEEFINEVVILSQINHRNIVKILGCCLETDVPVLVYEFIPNGNLFEHLHDELDDCTMITWDVRLRIAVDTAGALSYLHSAASSPIYHRDVKSTNIMLDEKYRAKVSDFGTSRSVTVDHTHLTTVVSGTMGYMDPEYFQSSQFTAKSDVYSFGVVLAELITGEKSISFFRSPENRTLASYFILAMKDNKLFDIIDARIRDGCKFDQVTKVAKIAKRCLNLKGKKRPTMREVSIELERIRSYLGDMQSHEYVSESEEEKEERVMEVNMGLDSFSNVSVTAPASQYNIGTSSLSYLEVEPLFPLQTN